MFLGFDYNASGTAEMNGAGVKDMPSLIHQVGNHLQSIRSEADLSRSFGALPQDSFERIVRAIETIRRLMAQLENMHAVETRRETADARGPARNSEPITPK
jgi:hypothetical protein